eukprot:TRINITY_DN49120_c0_g1_i1.p1 TRINITY_DN49120_c0_g1~~TRINITY_DN49120_c0_g1_i1.p1  ORF type:complete len:685 (+),score=135.04 TRINITY_DN49120_c0_g1_i1:220-2055(+)
MHVAQGLMKTELVNACIDNNCTFVFWVADIFAYINGKMCGDLEAIQKCGEYFIHVWKSCGMKIEQVEFLFAYPEINKQAEAYYRTVLDISRRFTISRIKKCATIMGKKEEQLCAAQLLYPIMQCSDPFFLKVRACQLGLDQRKVNMLAREYATATKRKNKPIVLSHHMMMGLVEGCGKASKSNPDSAVFMEDPPEEVERKIGKAFCPPKVEDNPVLDWLKNMVFLTDTPNFQAGGKDWNNYNDVEKAFLDGSLPEADLKGGLTNWLNQKLAPTHKHFEEDPDAKKLLEYLKEFKRKTAENPPPQGAVLKSIIEREKPKDAAFIMAPLARPKPTLGPMVSLLMQMKKATGDIVLCIPTWSSMVLNTMETNMGDWNKDLKKVTTFYDKLVKKLNQAEPELMKKVTIAYQHDSIASAASDYWYVAITAGQVLSVPTLIDRTPEQLESTGVSEVVSRLMFIADGLLSRCTTIVVDQDLAPLTECMKKICKDCGGGAPNVEVVKCELVQLTKLGGDAPADKRVIFLDDAKNIVAAKVKQAFCEPSNVEHNPLLTLAEQVIIPLEGKLDVPNHKVYTTDNWEEAKKEFAADTLTPQLLKQAMSAPVTALLDKLRWPK